MTTAKWMEWPTRPDYTGDDELSVSAIGDEGEYIVSFDEAMTPERLVELTYEYEKDVEQFDSRAEWDGEAYDPSDVYVVSANYHEDQYGEYRLYWGPLNEEYPVKERLVMKLNRW